jgi:hypothetical protein
MTRRRDVHVIAQRVRRWKVTQGGRTLSHYCTQETDRHDRRAASGETRPR